LGGSQALVRVNGLAARLTDLNIPVFVGSRVRFVVGLPGGLVDPTVDPNIQDAGAGTSTWLQDPSGVGPGAVARATWSNNIWHLNWSAFEPMENNDV